MSCPSRQAVTLISRRGLHAECLSKELGVPINVVNKPGGAHIPAVMSVKEAPSDGYTVLQFAPPSFMVVPLTRAVPYSVQGRLHADLGRVFRNQCALCSG